MTKGYEVRKEANKRYLSKLDNISIRVQKGQREEIKAYAEGRGESLNGFIVRAINETMQRDNDK